MNIKNFIPSIDWISNYNPKDFKGDLSAGITVGVMLIPQGMAYAMIAGLPPIYGLYASIMPLIVYALLGTSRQLAVGPVAMVSLLVAAGVGQIAESGTEEYISLAILLALMVGVIQFLLGVFRLGFLVNFLSHPVVSGFTSAAALIIGLSQLKHLLGIDIPRSSFVSEILKNAYEHLGEVHWQTLVIGIAGILVIVVLKKVNKAVPGSLVVVILGIALVYFTGLHEDGLKIVKEVPRGIPAIRVPAFSIVAVQKLFPIALAISLIGFMESIAVAKAIHRKHKNYTIVPNQELIALGLANVFGSFLKSFPTTGGFSRTAVNDQSGAKTGLASIISALLIAITLLFLTPLFYYLPKAILASIIMVAVFGLIDFKESIHLWKTDRADFSMLVITFLGTLFVGIEEGIGIGVVLSLVMIIFKTTRPNISILGQVPNTGVYRCVDIIDGLIIRNEILIVRPDARLYFANLSHFKTALDKVFEERGDQLKLFILSCEGINSVDSSAIHFLSDLKSDLKIQGVEFYVANAKKPVRDSFALAKLDKKVGEDKFFVSIHDSILAFDNRSK